MMIHSKKYLWLFLAALAFVACSDDDDSTGDPVVELTAGEADFSSYVSLGNSLTAGLTDGALFIEGQNNSLSNILAQQFAKVGGGSFSQPLMNDNTGGVLLGGTQIAPNRLVFNGLGPVRLEELNPTAMPSTDLLVNNPTGPFNNMGVPGAKSFHLLAPGYGNVQGLLTDPPTANPFFVRMASAPDTTILADALAQNPSFFTLWVGNNDVLGYATTGGDGSDPLTDVPTFTFVYGQIVSALTANGAKGVVANIPDVTTIPFFTTIPHNPLDPSNPSFGPLIPTLNTVFGALNPIFEAVDPSRAIVFSDSAASPVVIRDETLADISGIITQQLNASSTFPAFIGQFGLPPQAAPLVATLLGNLYGQTRQATPDDLLVLPSSGVIGTVNEAAAAFLESQGLSPALAAQFSTEGVTYGLDDQWVLLPSEQEEVRMATATFNQVIDDTATAAGLPLVDANALLSQVANGGLPFDEFTLTSSLVTGGAFSLDGVHPTARGYGLLANEFLKKIDEAYGSTFIASGNDLVAGEYPVAYPVILP